MSELRTASRHFAGHRALDATLQSSLRHKPGAPGARAKCSVACSLPPRRLCSGTYARRSQIRRGHLLPCLASEAEITKAGNTLQNNDEPELALILIACGIGLATGAGVVVFNDIIHAIRDLIWQSETLLTGRQLLREFSELELWPKLVIPPVLAGFFVSALGWLTGGYEDPLAEQKAVSQKQQRQRSKDNDAFLTNGASKDVRQARSKVQKRFSAIVRPVARAIAAAVTLGSGVSLGPEGPSVDIGKSCARGFAASLRSRRRHLVSLLAAGSGAGVAAGFNAPIAGVFFAVETVLQKQMLKQASRLESGTSTVDDVQDEQRIEKKDSAGLTIAMVLLASVLAAVVSQAGLGSSPAFRVPEYRLQSLYELPLYLLFGAVCGAVSASFSYSSRVVADAFEELRSGPAAAVLPAVGGLTTGVLALGYPEILYIGFENVNSVLASSGDYAPGLLIQIVVLKIIATTISRGSGLQGGIYAPSIFIGAALGSAFGLLAHAVGDPLGVLLSAPQAYALVGVAAMLASNCGVPLTAVLLLFELTRDYLIIIPTLGAVGISYWISSLAAPGVTSAAARRRATALAAAAAVSTDKDKDMLQNLAKRLRAATSTPTTTERSTEEAKASVYAEQLPSSVDAAVAPDQSSESLTLACAADRGCLLLQDDMPVRDALLLMEEEQQVVGVVLGQSGEVVGLVSRDVGQATRLAQGELTGEAKVDVLDKAVGT